MNAFVSGGFLPAAVRGTKLNEMIHIVDWYILRAIDMCHTWNPKTGWVI